MDFFYSMELSIPAIQMAMLLILNTLSLLFGRVRLALLITYLFTLYWGYILNQKFLIGSVLKDTNEFSYFFMYFGFGFVVIILSLIGFLVPKNK
jgi:hypothetical protein